LGPILAPAHADFFDGMEAYRRGDYEAALREWRPLAQRGDAETQYLLGTILEDPEAEQWDEARAAEWYRRAAEQGHAGAQARLGLMYEEGRGVGRDDAAAVHWYRRSATQGLATAQNGLGRLLEAGRGVDRDSSKAASWYRKAAEQGHARSQYDLARLFERGRGVSRSDEKAAKWYRRAARQGDAAAQNALGLMYDEGRGVRRNPAKAALWYRRAAEQGLAPARRNLASMYARGQGVPIDYGEALRWIELAGGETEDGSTAFRDDLAATMTVETVEEMRRQDPLREPDVPTPSPATGEPVQPVAATPAPDGAAEAPIPPSPVAAADGAEAAYRRARSYGLGEGVQPDRAEAERWYRRAADLGHGMACYRLGFLHMRGQNASGRKDPVQAWLWFSLAADQGLGDAESWRDRVADRMNVEQLAEARVLLERWRQEH
jgi:TPR repeat protein